jgi:V/A-type H+-transporting ATPase subunit E
MSKLEEILQAEVEAEINAILADADNRTAAILSEAQSRAAAQIAASRKKIEAEARAATQQAQSAAELSVSNARLQAKGEVMDLVQQQVRRALEETSSQPGYGETLQALAEEAMGMAKPAQAVVVPPSDAEKLQDWARQQGLELRTDPELRQGVRILSRSGIAIENTLPERLRRAWNPLGPMVAKLLWE